MKIQTIILTSALLWTAAAADITRGGFGAARDDQKVEGKSESSKSNSKSTARTYPFYGTLDSIDEKEKTVTLRGQKKNRVILFSSDTRVQKDGAYAKIHELVPGERVSGSVRKNADGKEEAVTIRSAPKKPRVGKAGINVR